MSHDRCFLDGCVDHILSLNRSNIEVQSGTFSAFLQNFEQQQRLEEAQNASLKRISEDFRSQQNVHKDGQTEWKPPKPGLRIKGISGISLRR